MQKKPLAIAAVSSPRTPRWQPRKRPPQTRGWEPFSEPPSGAAIGTTFIVHPAPWWRVLGAWTGASIAANSGGYY